MAVCGGERRGHLRLHFAEQAACGRAGGSATARRGCSALSFGALAKQLLGQIGLVAIDQRTHSATRCDADKEYNVEVGTLVADATAATRAVLALLGRGAPPLVPSATTATSVESVLAPANSQYFFSIGYSHYPKRDRPDFLEYALQNFGLCCKFTFRFFEVASSFCISQKTTFVLENNVEIYHANS